MKTKTVKIFALILSILVTLGAFVACSQTAKLNAMPEKERAVAIMRLTEEIMESYDSYTIDATVELFADVSGTIMNSSSTATEQHTGLLGDAPVHLSSSESEVTVNVMGMEQTVSTKTQDGFIDGKMFRYYSDDTAEQKLQSPITAEDYAEFKNYSVSDEAFYEALTACESVTAEQNDDKTWSLSFSDFTDEGLEKMLESLDQSVDMFGDEYPLADIVMTVSVGEDFSLIETTVELVFDAPEDHKAPSLKSVNRISAVNETAINDVPDLTDYTEVDDLRILTLVEKGLAARKSADKGSFETKLTQIYQQSSMTQTVKEVDNVAFEKKDGKYTYTVDAESEGVEYTMTYGDGKQTIKAVSEGETLIDETVDQTDAEAREFVNSLIDPSGFSASNVSDIRRQGNDSDRYALSLFIPDTSMLGEVKESSGTIFATVTEDGTLTAFEYKLSATVSTSPTLKYTLTVVCTFADE